MYLSLEERGNEEEEEDDKMMTKRTKGWTGGEESYEYNSIKYYNVISILFEKQKVHNNLLITERDNVISIMTLHSQETVCLYQLHLTTHKSNLMLFCW
jgi:hypothetical protein